jgi:hypothetical protein
MRRDSKYFALGAAVVIALVIIFFSVSFLANAFSDQLSTIYVKQVSGAPDFLNPGGEGFWSGVLSYSVPLIESISYAGSPSGHTDYVNVQMAWTATTAQPELLIRMAFPSPSDFAAVAPALEVPMLNDTANNLVYPMYNSSCVYPFERCYGGQYPQDVGFLPLATSPHISYPQQAIVVLGIAPGGNTSGWYKVSYKPKMIPGTSGALSTGAGGAAELWIWSRSPTDNSSADPSYPGIAYPNGTALDPSHFGLPPHASYAIDGYTNATSFYQLGGVPPSSMFPFINAPQFYDSNFSNIQTGSGMMNPFEVQAKGAYSSGMWVVEFVRPLNTPSNGGENGFQLQMNPSSATDYYASFAVSQESYGQGYLLYYNSVSFWWRFNFQTTSGFSGYNPNYG